MIKMESPTLRDGSNIELYTRIASSYTSTGTVEYLFFAEALTSTGQKVLLSCGSESYSLGREPSEEHPANKLHELEGRNSFPFWFLDECSCTALAIDEDGEIWILCSSSKNSKIAQHCGIDEVRVPTKTDLMKNRNIKAKSLRIEQDVITVTTVDGDLIQVYVDTEKARGEIM